MTNYSCQMFVPPKNKYELGSIKLTQESIVLYKKNKFLATGFGILGALLTKEKEFDQIAWSDISSIKMDKFKMNKKACYITLNNQSEYIFKLPKAEQSIENLKSVFEKYKKSMQ